MNLDELRLKIDTLDKEILSDFSERMDVCRQVALYKQENGLPVFQKGREHQILNKVTSSAPDGLETASSALFSCIMDISKCLQEQELLKNHEFLKPQDFKPETAKKIACQGVSGSNSETATRKLFPTQEIIFYHEFEDVFKAVENGDVDFGILPFQNSTAGSVTQTYDLMRKYNFFINRLIRTEITHCLAIREDTDISQVKKVYSHPQALSQCSEYISRLGLEAVPFENTATAGKFVAESKEPISAICSDSCAEIYGLKVHAKGISNSQPNYTRFICISKNFTASPKSDIVSVTITLPNTKGSLYRFLTKFFVSGLNLSRIESRPLGKGSFNVSFYLDFEGNALDERVSALLTSLDNEVEDFRFFGNYSEIF